MPELRFQVEEINALRYAAAPTITVRLRISNLPEDEVIQSVLLNCQLQVQPLGRAYAPLEEARLLDLFGEREQWGRTMKPLHWMNLVVKIPPFAGETTAELALPCSLDFDVAANKYFYGLDAGSVVVLAFFSGTAFYTGASGTVPVQIHQIPWDREARFDLPVEVWRAAVDAHYPDTRWLRLPRETFDRLYRYKSARGIPFWADLIEQLLDRAEQSEPEGTLAANGGGR